MADQAKIAVLISGRGSNMAALAKACQAGEIPAEISIVISDHDNAPGLQIANSLGIETTSFERKKFQTKSQHEAAILAALSAIKPDLICLAGFMRILSGDFVGAYQGNILNIHPSLLPKYKGLDTHARALKNSETEHGCTVHFVTEGLDDGPIVLQKTVAVEPRDTEQSLSEKVLAIEHQLYVDAVNIVLSRV